MIPSTPSFKTAYFRLLTYVKPYLLAFSIAIAAMILLGLSEAGIPALIKPLLDEGLIEKNLDNLTQTLSLFIILVLARGIFRFLSTGLMGWISGRVVMALRRDMFYHLHKLPTRYFDQQTSGTLISKVTYNVSEVTSAATKTITTLIRDSFTVIGLVLFALYLNWQLTLVIFLAFPPILFAGYYFSLRMRRLGHANQDKMGEMTHILQEAVKGNRIVKLFDGIDYENKRFDWISNKVRLLQQKLILAGVGNTSIVEMITTLIVSFIIFFGTYLAINQEKTAGDLFAFFTALSLTISPAKRLAKSMQPLQRGIAAAESIFALIDEREEKDRSTKALTQTGDINYQNVSFSYDGSDQYIIKNLSFTIPYGMTLALVGHSGSGKTTIANLLPRFYEINKGVLRINGQDISQVSLKSLRSQISMVSQNVVLFNDTVKANICYGMTEIPSDEAIAQALTNANADDFVGQLSKGILTQVGEDGVELSGGQKQRLAIARAFLKDAPILILDEATSALDTQSELKIQNALELLKKGKTTLIIAHRLSTIQNADKIIVLQNGVIIDSGSHEDLIHKSQVYQKLYHNDIID